MNFDYIAPRLTAVILVTAIVIELLLRVSYVCRN